MAWEVSPTAGGGAGPGPGGGAWGKGVDQRASARGRGAGPAAAATLGAAWVPLVARLLQLAKCLADQQAAVEAHRTSALLPGGRLGKPGFLHVLVEAGLHPWRAREKAEHPPQAPRAGCGRGRASARGACLQTEAEAPGLRALAGPAELAGAKVVRPGRNAGRGCREAGSRWEGSGGTGSEEELGLTPCNTHPTKSWVAGALRGCGGRSSWP